MQRTQPDSKLSPLFIFCYALVHYVFNYAFVHSTTHMQTLSRKKVWPGHGKVV